VEQWRVAGNWSGRQRRFRQLRARQRDPGGSLLRKVGEGRQRCLSF
jgi:hypothetical protein